MKPSTQGDRPRANDRTALNGVLFVPHTAIPCLWQNPPKELRFGSGMTCWRRPHAWLAGFGTLRMRLERALDTHLAVLNLACAVIRGRFVDQFC